MKTNQTLLKATVNRTFMRKSERVFAKLGLSTDDAINVFLAEVARHRAIPFRLALDAPERVDNGDILAPAAHRQSVLDSFYED